MNKQMTHTDIIRLGKAAGIEFSTEQAEVAELHIQKQLHSFEALEGINTENIDPTFDLNGEGRFKVGRWGK